MTSRFGKTYSRKGGDGSSKFDEVLSNKRATLSTKWGETTFKAQLGSKRPGLVPVPEPGETPKKPRRSEEEEDGSEDPFGFDSDEDSRPVSSRGAPQPRPAPTKVAAPEMRLAEWPSETRQLNSRVAAETAPASPDWRMEDAGVDAVSGRTPAGKAEGCETHSYSWYSKACESDRRPTPHTTSLKTDSWSSLAGPWPGVLALDEEGKTLCSEDQPLSEPDRDSPRSSAAADEPGRGDLDLPSEPSESDAPSQLPLRPSNCRTYRRPDRCKQAPGAGNGEGAGQASLKPSSAPGGRGRDYTVLHPSCLSVCNVTIQDSMERSIEDFPSAPSTDPGEAGRLKKKTETTPTKPTRFRPVQSKSKKESKLDFFGFEEKDGQDEEDPSASGSTNYKIKYFGFDDLSESDSEGEEDTSRAAEKRKAKKAAAAAAAAMAARFDYPELSDSQESQSSTNTDILEFPDDSYPAATEVPKRPRGKQSDKSGEASRKIFSGPKKSPAKAVYNARHWNHPEAEELPPPPLSRAQTAPASLSGGSREPNSHKDDGVFKTPPPPPKVIKSVTIPTEPYQDIVTALKCRKEHKELYTVVHNVKHFNDVVEFGENQEFTDDFEYLETGLKSGQPLNTRCLSVIGLATRCAMPSFRMHLRARGKVAQVFKTLNDAPQHPNLALCTASLMYILSRDRLNMDLDRACLELMIRLLELEQDPKTGEAELSSREMSKVKEKIRKLCDTVHNKHLDLENITTGHLAMETLLSLTSKRAGDWFKEELRLLGGLDHIVDKVKECVENLSEEEDEENLVASLWGAERCLRVLESVTVHNPENQSYLIAYKDSQLIVSSARALRHCEEKIQRYSREAPALRACGGAVLPHCSFSSVGKAVEDCMRAVIGVLLNLTHDNEWGSTKTGEQDQFITTALNCVLRVPQFLRQEQRFDIRVLGLGLLINLVEYSARNRHCLMDMQLDTPPCVGEELKTEGSLSAIAALVQLFLERERAAVLAEAETDDFINDAPKPQPDQSGEWKETSEEIQWVSAENCAENENNSEKEKKDEEDEELDLNKALQHAGKHMEDSIVASYTALLLGCLCQGSSVNVTTVRDNLPKGDFSIMTEMLKKFLNFMNLTCAVGTTGQKSISRVIDYLEHC
ncbi:wings apart-like protein homolog [Anguilla rostrata]|uniref:wings apart-like protein homolog n=1 Tax=Anguilla rostrata TaxID=7938 RepID=UPI0030D1BC17